MTNRELWFRIVVRVFPREYRVEHEDEIIEAVLAASPEGSWSGARESFALTKAGVAMTSRRNTTGRSLWANAAYGAAIWLGLLLGAGGVLRPLVGATRASSLSEYLTTQWAAPLGALLLLTAVGAARRSRLLAGLAGGIGVALTALWNSTPSWSFLASLWYELKWVGVALVAYVFLARRAANPPAWALAFASTVGMVAFVFAADISRKGESLTTLWWSYDVQQIATIAALIAVVAVWFVRGLGALAVVPAGHLTVVLALRPAGEALAGTLALVYFALAAYVTLKRKPRKVAQT